MNQRPLSQKEFKDIYSKVTRLCVDLIISTPNGIVLALRNLPSWNGKWHLPGGTVLYTESVDESVRRIANEEVGLSLNEIKLLGLIEYPSEKKERGFGHAVSMAFLCFSDGKNIKPNEEASDVRAFNKLPDNIIEEQRSFLEPIWPKIIK